MPSARWLALIARLAGTDVEPRILGEGNPSGEIDRQFVDPTKIREVVRLGAGCRAGGRPSPHDRVVSGAPGGARSGRRSGGLTSRF